MSSGSVGVGLQPSHQHVPAHLKAHIVARIIRSTSSHQEMESTRQGSKEDLEKYAIEHTSPAARELAADGHTATDKYGHALFQEDPKRAAAVR